MSTRIVTYSPSYTVVPTHECFNRCGYCNFRADRGAPWLAEAEVRQLLQPLVGSGVIEILILSGEVHPNDPRRERWLRMITSVCEMALELGFLPHTNCGMLGFAEMERLGQVNCSMGLMLEILSARLDEQVHRHAPSKRSARRLEQLEWAGTLAIPFTTGLLLGIGETEAERLHTLDSIADLQQRWGHIQEVILQPHRPGSDQVWKGEPFVEELLLATVGQARERLPTEVIIQIPPNLVQDPVPFLEAGARDLGGIGPVDVVNPDYDHPQVASLQEQLTRGGWTLTRRLPVYPHLYQKVPRAVQPVLGAHSLTLRYLHQNR